MHEEKQKTEKNELTKTHFILINQSLEQWALQQCISKIISYNFGSMKAKHLNKNLFVIITSDCQLYSVIKKDGFF